MTNEERDIQRKLRVLQHAEKVGNARKACRYFGVGRSSPAALLAGRPPGRGNDRDAFHEDLIATMRRGVNGSGLLTSWQQRHGCCRSDERR